jgi:16S rRNA (cytosine967-C5)-methyltransferase
MMKTDSNIDSREAALLAVVAAWEEKSFIHASLEAWQQKQKPSSQLFSTAREISYGVCRMRLSLEYIARQLGGNRLPKKRIERALLLCALYQACYMTQPLYAIVDSWVQLAKKHTHRSFSPFLNALLRRLEGGVPILPQGSTAEALSIRYSYPINLVEQLKAQYGEEKACQIMRMGNLPASTVVRYRGQKDTPFLPATSWQELEGSRWPMATMLDSSLLHAVASDADYHIQNATPAAIISALASDCTPPNTLLDLCAAPGGKLVAAHDLFPKATLYANDISAQRIERLLANIHHFNIDVICSVGCGTQYQAPEKLFDLIIIDAPCSNSGVFNRRPEARWRYNPEQLKQLEQLQLSLVEHCLTLLNPTGELWYMTCSIMPQENETLMHTISQRHSLKIRKSILLLPQTTGYDGGYGCALTR